MALVSVLATVLATVACAGATSVHTVADAGVAASTGRRSAPTSTVAPPLPACVATLSADRKAGQLLMVLVTAPAQAGDLVASGSVGGYALTGDQQGDLRAANAAVVASAPLPPFVSGDEEGGTVQRLRDVLGPLPSAARLAATGSATEAGDHFEAYAKRMAQLGFTMNLGPSLDVGSGSSLGSRSFGDAVDTVSAYGRAVIRGVRDGGLVAVAKHWPGIGGGSTDPHLGASSVATIDTLRSRDLVPFDDAIDDGLQAIMVSHAIVPGLTDGVPASLSRAAITGELRGREHFGGVVVTDSLGMGAVGAAAPSQPEAVVRSIAAGADIALVSDPKIVADVHRRLSAAISSGAIAAEQIDRSVGRVLVHKGVTGACPS